MSDLAELKGVALRDRLHAARASAVAAMREVSSDDLRASIADIDLVFGTAIRTAVAAYESLIAPSQAPAPEPAQEPAPSTKLDASMTIADPRSSPPPHPGEPLAVVVAAARLVDARLRAPLLLYGRPAVERADKAMAWRLRGQELMSMTVRLGVLDDPTNSRHPSLYEGLQLRDRISTAAFEATVQAKVFADPP